MSPSLDGPASAAELADALKSLLDGSRYNEEQGIVGAIAETHVEIAHALVEQAIGHLRIAHMMTDEEGPLLPPKR